MLILDADKPLPAGLPRAVRAIVAAALYLARPVRRALLRWQIWETEQWMRSCERDGLDLSISRPDLLADLAAMRVRLALLED